MESKEKKIVDLMMDRDKNAINLIYEDYSDALYGIVLRIVGDQEKAKDIMQDSFAKVWKNMSSYDESKAKLFTWLLRIFRNTAIDHLRRDKKNMLVDIQNELEGVDNKRSVSFNPDTIDLSIHLAKLDHKFRNVIEKIYMVGMTHCETSEALDIPLGTVKSRLRLGLSALRKIYIPLIFILINNLV